MNTIKILGRDADGELVEVAIGDTVHDDLTGESASIVDIIDEHVLKIDSTYLDGYRYTWEVSDILRR